VSDLVPWLSVSLAIVVLAGWYLYVCAVRVDRLHHRVESARAALETQLARRAAAAMELTRVLDPATGVVLAAAAYEAQDDEEDPAGGGVSDLPDHLREEVENDLTRAIEAAFGDPDQVDTLRRDPVAADLLDRLAQASTRVQLARRFHNDAVAHAQRMRRKRVVRWARLAGRAAMPQMVEIDDSMPSALRTATHAWGRGT